MHSEASLGGLNEAKHDLRKARVQSCEGLAPSFARARHPLD